jgi:hypothetical protein
MIKLFQYVSTQSVGPSFLVTAQAMGISGEEFARIAQTLLHHGDGPGFLIDRVLRDEQAKHVIVGLMLTRLE